MRLPDGRRSRAVLLGTSEYLHPELAPLPAVRNNLADLAAVLTSPTETGLPSENCTILLDQTDVEVVGDRLETAAAQADDLLLVYYAGHGLLDLQGLRAEFDRSMLKPEDVLHTAFRKPRIGKRGYDGDQVDTFLDQVEYELCKGIDDAVSLTERDVRNVTFAKPRMGNRGYDEDEVDTFLDLVERELARRQDIQRRYLEAGG